jgi:hypothetical protein
MVRYEDPNVPLSAVVGLVGAVLLFVIIVGLQALFYGMEQREMAKKVYSQPYQALQQLDSEQLERLNSYGWVNEQKGEVHIPIERAMELVAQERAQK